jgi:hypothetical protein
MRPYWACSSAKVPDFFKKVWTADMFLSKIDISQG